MQIKLAPLESPFFAQANLLIAADCCAYAFGVFHAHFLRRRAALIGCPKLDMTGYAEKLAQSFARNDIRSITVARMQAPCCGGLQYTVERALAACGREIPLRVETISTDGRLI